jgi:regulator of sirC expression with transglutaminase-like and TPR domain
MTPSSSYDQVHQDFKNFIGKLDMNWDMVEGALLIARQQYPDLDEVKYKDLVEVMARRAVEKLSKASTKLQKISALNSFFFDELGFHGNADEYYDPRNSYLSDVLERKEGIPITLSMIYLVLGWKAGLPLHGINFPGHFLVEWRESPADMTQNVFIDVFGGGKILSVEDLQERLNKNMGSPQKFEPVFHLQSAGIRGILHRALGNLKAIHASQGQVERALWATEWMLMLKSNDWNSLRDKGLFSYSLGNYEQAEECLETYLEKTGKPVDYAQVWQVLYAMKSRNNINLN